MTPNSSLPEPQEEALIHEMEQLEDAVRASTISTPMKIVRGFLYGISSTLGALVTVAILIPILAYFLKNIQWIPLIGTFVERVSEYMK
jgi:ABC-type multidrug transport system permease subunit